MTKRTVECSKHGTSEAVFVCNHETRTLHDGQPRGLRMWHDDNGNICGWCHECAARADASTVGPDRVPLKFQVDSLCVKCFEPIRLANGGGVWDR
jgi:hypothetical protein